MSQQSRNPSTTPNGWFATTSSGPLRGILAIDCGSRSTRMPISRTASFQKEASSDALARHSSYFACRLRRPDTSSTFRMRTRVARSRLASDIEKGL
jgi:hypothetical protein